MTQLPVSLIDGAPRLARGVGVSAASFLQALELERWQASALCAQVDPEVFFPDKGGSTKEAKRICQGCEVRSECLEYALEREERFGVWGGLSERERRAKRGVHDAALLRRIAEVRRLDAAGMTRRQIAAELGVHETTVGMDLRRSDPLEEASVPDLFGGAA